MSVFLTLLLMAAPSSVAQAQSLSPADAVQATDALNQTLDAYNDSESNACTVQAAQEPNESITDFCTDPYWAICQDYVIKGDERTRRREKLIKEAKDYALAKTRKVAGKKFKPIEPSLEVLKTDWVNIWHTFTYYDHLSSYISQRNLSIELNAVATVSHEMKTLLQKAVVEQPINGRQKAKLKARIRDTIFVYKALIESIFPNSGKSSDATMKLFKSYYNYCGVDGMKDNAFQYRIGKKYYVVVCPGRVLAGSDDSNDQELNRLNLLHDMGHEMGHHFDWDEEASIYKKYFTCISEHHAESIKENSNEMIVSFKKALDRIYGEEWLKKIRRDEKTRKYLTEITADFWGIELVVQYLKSLPEEKRTYDYALKVLRTSMSGMCDNEQSDSHPSGAFRIEVMARRHPYLHDLMGCSRADYAHAKPGCTLSGPTKRALY